MHCLSPRETEVLRLAMTGLIAKEIAVVLSVSAKTIEQYWSRIYGKTGVRGREAVIASVFVYVAGCLTRA